MGKFTRILAAAAAAALLVGGVVLLTKDEAAQKIVDRKMADFQPSASMMDTLDILTEELENTETTPVSTMAEEEMTGTTEGAPVQETAPYIPSDTLPAEVMDELTAQAAALQAAYPNAIGWLYLPDTGINYPIMQGEDNDFYLHHAPDGRSLKAGSVFLDFRCERRFMNPVNLVYAHNMNNGTMFAGITKFTNSAYFSSHRYGWLATSETVFRIDFFSAAVVGRYDVLYDGSAEISSWLSHLAEVSKIYENANISGDTRFISLSTCSYEFKDARTVLTGTLTEMGGV